MKLNQANDKLTLLSSALQSIKCDKLQIYNNAFKCVLNEEGEFHVLIIGGLHGDEPAGVCAAVELLTKQYQNDACITVIPCANPAGFKHERRENEDGEDINRQFDDGTKQEEELVLRDMVAQCDLLITLHEDGTRDGCYAYAPKLYAKIGRSALKAMSRHVDVTQDADVFGDYCDAGLITDIHLNNPKHGQSVEGFGKKMGVPSFCLEVPISNDIGSRIEALVAGTMEIINNFQ